MRITRIIATVVAFAMVALAPLALTTGASAADFGERAKPKHVGKALGKEIGNTNKFITYGKWSSYKGKNITVQRRACGGCQWKFYKKTKTSAGEGKFRTGIAPGRRGSRVCYRVAVPPTSKYRLTRVVVGCITTT
ncbi:MAG TPA: hypothetical protein VNQ53_16225 [Nocardioides sp.]|nr:hypothetical protein [Nocardioides sp.]